MYNKCNIEDVQKKSESVTLTGVVGPVNPVKGESDKLPNPRGAVFKIFTVGI